MKKAIVGIISLLALSCSSTTKDVEYKQTKADTIREAAIFINNIGTLELQLDYVWRVTKDTFATEKIDTIGNDLVAKRKWFRDTLYFIPQFMVQKDSTGKPIMDSATKKPKQTLYFANADKAVILIESNKNLIPLFKQIEAMKQTQQTKK